MEPKNNISISYDIREGAFKIHKAALAQNVIELDITSSCNLSCVDCTRGCDILGSEYKRGNLSLADVKQFIAETENLNHKWKRIKVVGGEPTLHPEVLDIVAVLYEHCRSRGTLLSFHTNSATSKTRQIYKSLQAKFPSLMGFSSPKTLGQTIYPQFFITPWINPEDIGEKNAIQKGACWCPTECGMGLSSTGYGICCGIHMYVRAYKTDSEIKTLADLFDPDKIVAHIERFCTHCGITLKHNKFSASVGGKARVSRYWYDFFKLEHPAHWDSICKIIEPKLNHNGG